MPLPSSKFFLTRSSAFGETFLASAGSQIPHEFNKTKPAIVKKTNKVLVEIDSYFFRPTEVNQLLGDFSKINDDLNWKPKVTFNELVKIMVQSDWKKVKNRGY